MFWVTCLSAEAFAEPLTSLASTSAASLLRAGVRGTRCGDGFGILSQRRSRGFLLVEVSPSGISLPFQSLPAGNVLFYAILLAGVGLAELGGIKGGVLWPNRAGIAEHIWKTRVIHGSCFFVQEVFLLD